MSAVATAQDRATPVIPAQAGIQSLRKMHFALGPRLRGDERRIAAIIAISTSNACAYSAASFGMISARNNSSERRACCKVMAPKNR